MSTLYGREGGGCVRCTGRRSVKRLRFSRATDPSRRRGAARWLTRGAAALAARAQGPTKVVELLMIGGAECARDREALRRAGVSCVLNCAAECRNHFESDLSYTHLQLKVPAPPVPPPHLPRPLSPPSPAPRSLRAAPADAGGARAGLAN